MVGTVMNCKKCNKIFQQRLHPICPACLQREDQQFTNLYRLLQNSAGFGGIDINTLAVRVGMSADQIEKWYMEGRLSTAGLFLKMPCQSCGSMCGEHQRKGRYCLKCSEMTANQAGVEVKTVQELQREEADEQRRLQQESLLRQNRLNLAKKEEISRFGFTVRQH